MKYQLTALEARVIGCLLEKQVTTPEQYPLSVDAGTTGKSRRWSFCGASGPRTG